MTKQIIVLLMLILFWEEPLQACDACGCSVGLGSFGLFEAFHNNYFSIAWNNTSFESIPGYGNSIDYFNTIEINAQYYLSSKLRILLNVPYKVNKRNSSGSFSRIDGLSDSKIMIGYSLLKNEPLSEYSELFFDLAGGIKFPTGIYDAHIHDKNLPENFNLGNGSFGFVLQPNLVFSYKKVGLVTNISYQYLLETSEGYHFGNQLSSQLVGYINTSVISDFELTPFIGFSYEKVDADTYSNGKFVNGTGANGTFLSAGLSIKLSTISGGITYQSPINSNYSSGKVKATGKISVQLYYLF